jgi:hypothetical protein
MCGQMFLYQDRYHLQQRRPIWQSSDEQPEVEDLVVAAGERIL